MAADAYLGRQIGPYKTLSLLGKGGMGRVYKAVDGEGHEVALKILPLDPDEGAPGTLAARFKREVQACLDLQHLHIVRLYDAGTEEDCDWFSMEVLEGLTLQQVVKRQGRLPREEVFRIVKELAGALGYIHERGIIHRDLKPGNIMVLRSGRTVLMDFGLAKVLDRTRITKTGHGLGTPRYMAPEMLMGKTPVPSTDLYQLGVILYELLSGETAVKAKSFATLAHELTQVYPPALTSLDPEVGPDLDALVFNCLEKDPDDRYPDAESFLDDLARVRRGEPVVRRGDPHGEAGRPLSPTDFSDAPTAEAPSSPTAPSSRPGPAAAPSVPPRRGSGALVRQPRVASSSLSAPRPQVGPQDEASLASLSHPVLVQSAGRGAALAAALVLVVLGSAWWFAPGAPGDHRLQGAPRIMVSPKGARFEFRTVAPVPTAVRVRRFEPGSSGDFAGTAREFRPSGEARIRHRVELTGLQAGSRYVAEILFPDGGADHPTQFGLPREGEVPAPGVRWISARRLELTVRCGFPVSGQLQLVGGASRPLSDEAAGELREEWRVPLEFDADFVDPPPVRLKLAGAAGWETEVGPFDYPAVDGQLLDDLSSIDPSAEVRRALSRRAEQGGSAAVRLLRERIEELGLINTLDDFRAHAGPFFSAAEVPLARKFQLFHRLQELARIDLFCTASGVARLMNVAKLYSDFLSTGTRLSYELPGGGVPDDVEVRQRRLAPGPRIFRPVEVSPGDFQPGVDRSIRVYGQHRRIREVERVPFDLPDPLPDRVAFQVEVLNLSPWGFVELEVNRAVRVELHDPAAAADLVEGPDLPLVDSLPRTRVVLDGMPSGLLRSGRNEVAVRLHRLGPPGDYAPAVARVAAYYR